MRTMVRRSKREVKAKWVEVMIECNKCGRMEYIDQADPWAFDEFIEIKHHFGYGSKNDGEEWTFDICEKCLEEFTKTFKTKPHKFDRG